jgi:hypothetical protein
MGYYLAPLPGLYGRLQRPHYLDTTFLRAACIFAVNCLEDVFA